MAAALSTNLQGEKPEVRCVSMLFLARIILH
jgi:hypothetical protein